MPCPSPLCVWRATTASGALHIRRSDVAPPAHQRPDSLADVQIPVPVPGPHDLLVRVEAVSVNPVDVKVRAGHDPRGEIKILGFDAAGVVVAAGDQVSSFAAGDKVWYAGSIRRPGT